MTSAKITIECEDPLLKAALASAISRGLLAEGFTNQQAKVMMVYQRFEKGSKVQDFEKRNIIVDTIGMTPESKLVEKADAYDFMLVQAPRYIDTDPPSCSEALRERKPELFQAPILIDMNWDPPPFAKALTSFKQGGSDGNS